MPSSPQRVYLHVGLPKTGTSFLQAVLFSAREELRADGVLYPADDYDDHFFAALDLQDLAFNDVVRPEAAGRWDALAAQVRGWPGTSVVSSEVLAAAPPDRALRAIDSLAPAEVHVVVTVRDPATHLVSTWQEDVKHGETADLAAWCAAIAAHDTSRWNLAWYWRASDLPSVLERWGALLPPERVHVVTVPASGAPPDTLWRRFAPTVSIDPGSLDLARTAWGNFGLGAESTAFLRRMNRERSRLDQISYEHLVKGVLAHETLARYPRPARAALPASARGFAEQRADAWGEAVRTLGADVVGDLADLRPPPVAATGPDEVAAEDVLDAAVFAAWELLLRVRETRATNARLRGELDTLRHQLAVARGAGTIKHAVRRASEHSPALMRARVAWWHTVERLRDS